MIAVAVAALLTTGALTIWATKATRRPVDWSGKLTRPRTRPAASGFRAGGTIPTGQIDPTPFIHGDPSPATLTVTFDDELSGYVTRALRASERDDRRREGR